MLTSRLFVIVSEDDITEVHDSTVCEGGGFMVFTSYEKAVEMIEQIRLDLPGKKWEAIALSDYIEAVVGVSYFEGYESGRN